MRFLNSMCALAYKHFAFKFMRVLNLPACQTYCTQTYVLAKKNSQLTGIKNRHTKSDVIAMQINSIENACNDL